MFNRKSYLETLTKIQHEKANLWNVFVNPPRSTYWHQNETMAAESPLYNYNVVRTDFILKRCVTFHGRAHTGESLGRKINFKFCSNRARTYVRLCGQLEKAQFVRAQRHVAIRLELLQPFVALLPPILFTYVNTCVCARGSDGGNSIYWLPEAFNNTHTTPPPLFER